MLLKIRCAATQSRLPLTAVPLPTNPKLALILLEYLQNCGLHPMIGKMHITISFFYFLFVASEEAFPIQ